MVNGGAAWRHTQKTLSNAGLQPAPSEGKALVAHVVNLPENELIFHESTPLTPAQSQQLESLTTQRLSGKPLAYVLGYAWFAGHKWNVTPATLIPRPDTEILLQTALAACPSTPFTAAEVGVGSGALIGSLALATPHGTWHGTDISPSALHVAQSNLTAHGLINTHLHAANLLQGLTGPFHLIVSNPPYISQPEYDTLDNSVKNYEPATALLATHNGLEFYQRLATEAPPLLISGGHLMVEIGHTQAEAVTHIFQQAGLTHIQTHQDLASRPRVITAKKKSSSPS